MNRDLIAEIKKLSKQKKAVILAHYYQLPEIQDIADFIGDSLQLSQQAAKTDAKIIVFAGVNFMAETAKILSPSKKVLIPDAEAGCSLADSCPADDFKRFKEQYPDHIVISYVNTTAEIKALTDITCTSSNALKIVNSVPKDKKIIFAPDRNLGNYLNGVTGRNMVLWDGACHVHDQFSLEKIIELKKQNPKAKLLAHPECKKQILLLADYVGSTSSLLQYSIDDNSSVYIVATESGILHQMKKENPSKSFIPAPPDDSSCACNDCKYMKLITLEKLYTSLLNETIEINVAESIRVKAEKSILRMLELS
jgi:quinolinate synthase